jgi:tight adherence protein B
VSAGIAILVFVITFVAAGAAVLIGSLALQNGGVTEPSETGEAALFKNSSLSTISVWASLLERFDFVEILRRQLAQADLEWSVGRLTLLMLLSGAVALALLMTQPWVPGWAALPAAVGAAALPQSYVLRRRRRRFARFEEQFPDALDSLARALRAGHPFAAGMEIIAAESSAPVSAEMRKTALEGNLGASWDQALDNLAGRVPVLEVNMFVSAVQLQTRAGGKLSDILGTLAESMREAASLKGEVHALAAHGKLTGAILTAVPVIIVFIMSLVNPGYLNPLLQHPYGKHMIATAVAMLVLAHVVIRRIVNIRI